MTDKPVIPALLEIEQENQEIKVIVGYIMCLERMRAHPV